LTCSRDLTSRLYSAEKIEGYEPFTFSSHKDRVMGAFFATNHLAV